jgi:hypothetical protein
MSRFIYHLLFGVICVLPIVKGFASTRQHVTHDSGSSAARVVKQTRLMSNMFEDMGKFFNGLGKNKVDFDVPEVEEIDGEYVGSKRIITIPGEFMWLILTFQLYTRLSNSPITTHKAKTMKLGGLRLYCNLYLLGLQNTPEPGCWKAHKVDDTEVNLRYVDMTGSIIITFKEDDITIDRLGSMPSQKYLLHESIVLNGFLDQLESIVFEGVIAEKNRLLTLPEPADQIQKARDVLSFS